MSSKVKKIFFMKYNKNIQNKAFLEKIFKNHKKKRLWEYFPPILKNIKIEINGTGEERIRKVTYLLFTLYLN